MNVALRHGVTDLAAIKRAYDSLGDGNVMAGGGPAKTKEPPFSLAQRAAENRARKAHLFDDGGDEPTKYRSTNPLTPEAIVENLAYKLYPLSSAIMSAGHGAQFANSPSEFKEQFLEFLEPYIRGAYDHYQHNPDAYVRTDLNSPAQSTYLLPRGMQDVIIKRYGYIPGKKGDYGLVNRAVTNRFGNLPVWQTAPDAIDRDELLLIGRLPEMAGSQYAFGTNNPYVKEDVELQDAGSYPTNIYLNPETGNFYSKSWDLNNYGHDDVSSGSFYSDFYKAPAKFAADLVDKIGSPIVVTTGFQPMYDVDVLDEVGRYKVSDRLLHYGDNSSLPDDIVEPLNTFMTGKGLQRIGDSYIWGLPEVTVTLKKKAHGGKLNLFDDGGQEDVIDWGNVRASGGRLNKFDGLDNLDRPNQMETAFDDLVAAKDRYAQTGDINTSWEPVDLNDVSITDNGFITREGRTGNSFVLPEAYVYGSRPATSEQSMVARRNDGQESESLLDKLVDIAGSAVAPFLAPLVGTAAAATPSKPFVVNKKQVAGQTDEPAKEALHTVKSGENLSTIARNYGVDIGDIISSNGIANPDFIKPGQQLRIPGAGNRAMHTVKSGENLSSIAKKYGVSVDRIASINGIANPDFIKPGQELRIPNVNNDTSRTLWTPKQIKEEEARINAGGNVAIIHNYHSNKGKGKVYVIDDKLHNKVHVCKDGRVIKSYNGIHSWNAAEDDIMTTTYVDKHGNIRDRAGNGMTPSGVFFLSRTNNYHGAPAFMRRTQEQVRNGSKKGVPNSIHLRTMKENAVTNGCTGMDAASLRDFASRVPDGTPCYILPANSDNKFFMRNGELQFHSSDTSKVPAYNVKTSTPIERITAKVNGLSDTQRGVINGFSKGLIRHKSQLQRELGLNDDTYDRLATIALGILGRESNFGEEHSAIGNFARAVTKKLNHDTSSPDYKSKYATYGANSDNNSVGLTQLRIAGLSDKERKLFERFGITKDSLVYEPELAAIATMIKLGYDYVNTGQNFDNTIAHWNGNRKGYVDQVKDIIDRRFEIYKKYGNK